MGAGAVGTYLGELLAAHGNQVSYAPRSLEDVERIGQIDADLAIVAVKAYDTDGAIATLRAALREPAKTTIVTPQNGIGNEEKLAAAFGADAVVACALTVPVGVDPRGHASATNRGGIAFAPVGDTAHNWLLATFSAAGLTVQACPDYRAMKWSKLALNIVANASCAILNVLPERLVHFGDVFALEIRAIREVAAVMKALHLAPVDLPRYPVKALLGITALPTPVAKAVLANRIASARGRKPPSLLQDLRAGKNVTEVEVLNGAVAAAAAQAGVAAPVNAVFARVLSDIAHMPALWAKYRERPEALEAEVDAELARGRREPSAAPR